MGLAGAVALLPLPALVVAALSRECVGVRSSPSPSAPLPRSGESIPPGPKPRRSVELLLAETLPERRLRDAAEDEESVREGCGCAGRSLPGSGPPPKKGARCGVLEPLWP